MFAALLLVPTAIGAAPPRKPKAAIVKPPPQPPPVLDVPEATRLLVIAPHPDDEVLGAGGLMQRVHATGGAVRVVYLTDGEGYPEGVMESDHTLKPTVKDYLGYGKQRRREARNALVRARAARRVPDVSRLPGWRALQADAHLLVAAPRRLPLAVHAPQPSAQIRDARCRPRSSAARICRRSWR